MSNLILTVGLPRSGKTTYARSQNAPIVNPDSIRLALHGKRYEQLAEDLVWAIAKIMVRSLFLAGHETVIVDATNTTKKRRDFWKSNDWTLQYHEVETSEEECVQRALHVDDTEIIPVIKRMSLQFEALTEEEVKMLV